MHDYNLLDEKWIEVVRKDDQSCKVSILDLFQHAQDYRQLSGETPTQDFAILRLLLAILETTFLRYQSNGEKQTTNNLSRTWQDLWDQHHFPMDTIHKYLDNWHDRFNLYDDTRPFYQITPQEMDDNKGELNQNNPSELHARLLNRTISESDNKPNRFSAPYKDVMTDDMFARWLVLAQGAIGTGDKAKFKSDKSKGNRGWILSIGGIYLKGDDLFQTLMLNLILNREEYRKDGRPIWEWSIQEKMDPERPERASAPKNLVEIYTNCARLLSIKPGTGTDKGNLTLKSIKLPAIEPSSYPEEAMTLWKRGTDGKKERNIPRPHNPQQSLWRSFGHLYQSKKNIKSPRIMDWYKSLIDNEMISIQQEQIARIVAVGMHHTSDASNTPDGETHDELDVSREIFYYTKGQELSNDNELLKKVGYQNLPWQNIIDIEVKKTQRIIKELRYFANQLTWLRFRKEIPDPSMKDNNTSLGEQIERQAYFQVDAPFKEWLRSIDVEKEEPNNVGHRWRKELFHHIDKLAKSLWQPLRSSDLQSAWNESSNSNDNVITLYDNFRDWIRDQLKLNQKGA